MRLRELVAARADAQTAVDLEVMRLRGLRIGWVPIAEALQISRQGARQRYGGRPAGKWLALPTSR